ncbi:hypothetical protein DXG01_015594 [Tephrocybe rancida]|nr:hypothetical protein DXG01_015594 [Tephrocybe rancida]
MDPTPFPNAPFMEAEDSEDPELIQAVNNVDALPFYSYSTWSQLYLVGMPQDTENVMANYIMKEERRKLAGKKKKYHLELLFGDCFPVDLFFEILGHLHPIDLYHMSLANKSSRKAVMSRSGSLWKTCFARHPELPSCPTDMSEQNWAILLFSPFLCDECGIHSAVIDFAYRRRLCYDCLRLNQVVRTPQNEDITYQENDPIWDLAPASNREGGDSYWFPYATLESTRRDGRYLKRDILAVAKELQELQIQNPEAVESWKRNKEKYTGTRIQHAERCNKWAADIFDLRYEEDRERQSRIEDSETRVIERMISLGHDRDDVATNDLNLFLFYSNVEIPKLTRRVWRLIKTPVENVVSTTKENRRRWAREDLLRRRGEVLRATYLAHQKALEPRSWITLPDYEDLLRFEAFSDLMNDASEIDLTPLACRPAMDKLPEYVVDWGRRRMAHMMNLLPNSEASELDRDGAEELCIQKLSLATSIFACVDCKLKPVAGDCLFGWHDVSTHARCYKMAKQGLKNIVLCTNGASIASAVVTFLGLDPSTASASEMDQLEARLVCSRCPMRHHRGTFGRKAYTWRDYVRIPESTLCIGLSAHSEIGRTCCTDATLLKRRTFDE